MCIDLMCNDLLLWEADPITLIGSIGTGRREPMTCADVRAARQKEAPSEVK